MARATTKVQKQQSRKKTQAYHKPSHSKQMPVGSLQGGESWRCHDCIWAIVVGYQAGVGFFWFSWLHLSTLAGSLERAAAQHMKPGRGHGDARSGVYCGGRSSVEQASALGWGTELWGTVLWGTVLWGTVLWGMCCGALCYGAPCCRH